MQFISSVTASVPTLRRRLRSRSLRHPDNSPTLTLPRSNSLELVARRTTSVTNSLALISDVALTKPLSITTFRLLARHMPGSPGLAKLSTFTYCRHHLMPASTNINTQLVGTPIPRRINPRALDCGGRHSLAATSQHWPQRGTRLHQPIRRNSCSSHRALHRLRTATLRLVTFRQQSTIPLPACRWRQFRMPFRISPLQPTKTRCGSHLTRSFQAHPPIRSTSSSMVVNGQFFHLPQRELAPTEVFSFFTTSIPASTRCPLWPREQPMGHPRRRLRRGKSPISAFPQQPISSGILTRPKQNV